MIQSLYVIRSREVDPRHNLALEEYLLQGVKSGECILYLWQNQRTVVIGRNQHAENECHIQALEADGGYLVRRLSGGGAVYHDLGNVNFTIVTTRENFDVDRQTEVILRAVQKVGLRAEKNGRNDLTVEGRKFSGHSYYKSGSQCFHNGTIMVDVDKEPLEKYLNISLLKLRAKGVKSVRSRVANLREYLPDLTVSQLNRALIEAFGDVYGLPVAELRYEDIDQEALACGQAWFSRPEWIYGKSQSLPVRREARFDWGILRIDYAEEAGVITDAALWSDGLEADFLGRVPGLLKGCPLAGEFLAERLRAQPGASEDLVESILVLLRGNEE
ncbi:MAG: lipoate--protein ligase [Ruminiclostridium sp.]|nr:lipoate--protein ligase [Ruminiclostridium sp.]